MSLRRGWWMLMAAVLLMAAVPACNRGEEVVGSTPETTRAASGSATTTTATAPAGTEGGGGTTTTAMSQPEIDTHVRFRGSGESGDVLVVLIEPPGAYTDVQLENLLGDFLEGYDGDVDTLHMVDDESAIPLVRRNRANLDADQLATLDRHYVLRLTDGNQVAFEGPFAEYPAFVVGS